ncbi:activator protein [Chromobacterium sinusclupearum]|uniref:Activator protein n=1 Tax=Chromobacterium sinusclupearum TaxID=2077146 RepID=A0A2K4MJA5_9NEIS|nr:activator protein [Chromobacterium sinusclupearum]POA97187.1 activator protein [Chromobacterium sinusclupearum]
MSKISKIQAGAALALALGCVVSAGAVTITPPGAGGAAIPFSAVGPATVSKGGVDVDCNAVFSGTVDGAGNIRITSAAFKGIPVCRMIKASATAATPWVGRVTAQNQLAIVGVMVDVQAPILGGQCGPSQIAGTISDNGSETTIGLSSAPLAGGCAISAKLNTTPYMHVTP